ncbi:MAG TPA: DUF1552 domain-containing protein [Polyangia bacterium]|nr:DUF1552 domain-containing protein [Polyangia bacterium]
MNAKTSGNRVIDPNLSYDEKALASQQKEAAQRPPSRRTFLASAAATVGLPWMESLVGRNKAEAAPARPVRFVGWHTPNGIYRQNWFPAAVAGPNYTLSPSLAPLESLKKKLLVFSGMQNNDASVVFGSHGLGVSGMLTCVLGTKPGIKVGVSVDQVYAKSLGTSGRFPQGLQIGITSDMYADVGNPAIYNGCISWASETQPLQPVIQSGVTFDQIFMGADPTASAADRMKRQAIASSVLDHVTTEAKSIQLRLGKTDKTKLEEYLTGVRSLETKIQTTPGLSCAPGATMKPANTGLDWPTHTTVSIDLMVLALQCDATRVITFMLGNGGDKSARSFPWLMVSGDHHGLAHAQNGPALSTIDKWHVSQLALFCQKLDAIDEGGTTMLDNSVVFMSSEIASGIAHDQTNKGVLVLGSAGGKLKTGQHLITPNEPQANLFVALLNALQVPVTTFGTAGKKPLDGIL